MVVGLFKPGLARLTRVTQVCAVPAVACAGRASPDRVAAWAFSSG